MAVEKLATASSVGSCGAPPDGAIKGSILNAGKRFLFGTSWDASDVIVVLHYCIFAAVLYGTTSILRREYQRALESYMRVTEQIKSEEEKHAWELGNPNSAEGQIIEPGDEVVHADLGKGTVLFIDKNKCTVEFEAMNDTKNVDIKNLLFLGMRVKHGSRGWGTIEKFDETDRVHVNFDSGEYHRYKFEAWKRKMIPQAHSRLYVERQTFRQFLYQYMLYRSDYFLTTFTTAKPLVLLLSTYTLIVVGASVYSRVSGKSTAESLWVAWTMVADPGTHADEEGTLQRTVALFLTLGGMLVFALMIGIIADGVSSLLDELKQGNSSVIENGHTLVLGWSDKTLPLVREVCLANESMGGGVVVILADRPKAEMEREVLEVLPPREARGTLIICRSGNPTNQTDLRKVSAGSARSVVVLADNKMEPDESDARAVRAVLSLHGIRKSQMGHVVVEMCDVDNRDLAHLADSKNVEVVVAHDLIGRLMIQCAREPGLAQILDEMLGFEGDEFYIKAWPGQFAPGITFGEILFRFEDAIPLGIKPHDRRDAYRQLRDSKWRKESLKRRGWDGASPSIRASNDDQNYSIRDSTNSALDRIDEDDFALRQGSSDIPVIDHFATTHRPFYGETAETITTETLMTNATVQPNSPVFPNDDSGPEDEDENERQSRAILLNPPNDYILREKDEILVLAEDDDSYLPKPWDKLPKSARQAFDSMEPAHRPIVQTRPEKFLFCGWRRDMDDMILELDQLVGPGSEVTIMCMTPEDERIRRFQQGGLDVNRLKNLSIRHVMGNPILRRDLKRLPNRLDSYGSILILADQALETNVSSADSRSLASLLLIRDMIAKKLKKRENLTRLSSTASNNNSVSGSGRPFVFEKSQSFSDGEPSPRVFAPSPSGAPYQSDSAQSNNNNGTRSSTPTNTNYSNGPLSLSSAVAGADYAALSPSSQQASPAPAPISVRASRLGMISGGGGGGGGEASSSNVNNSSFARRSSSSLQHDYFVRRPSSVGQALFFENAHNTGSTVLISEILDSRTKALVPVAQIGDHVMSNEIVAATLAMVSECRDISVILNELLQADGNDLHIRSALDYGIPGERIDFWQLQARARARGEIAVGYKSPGDKAPTLNPREKCAKFTLSAKGTIIVIAED